MTLARLTDLIQPAAAGHYGVGAFNVFSIEHAEALVSGAEQAGMPVVLQISQNAVRYHGALEPIAQATLALARRAAVAAVVHLDHATEEKLVSEAIELGFGSVMFDASQMPYADNVAVTAAVAERCHQAGLDVEAELGEIGGKDGVHAPGIRTDPEQAAQFVTATGVDALAVAVGSAHAMTERVASLDLELIGRLRDRLAVPLVLHGSSGVSDDELVRAIGSGMTKINVATHLNAVFTGEVRDRLAADPSLVDSRKYLGPARSAVADEVTRLLRLLTREQR